jgi:tetratricopeptide (TPR) repeat protein
VREFAINLAFEEDNIRQALRLALKGKWWNPLVQAMQSLSSLYQHTGRGLEWKRLVEEVVPWAIDPVTNWPHANSDLAMEDWAYLMEFRVELAKKERRFEEAERIQRDVLAWQRQRAAHLLSPDAGIPDKAGMSILRDLAKELNGLGQIQRLMGNPECIKHYEEAIALFHVIGAITHEIGAKTYEAGVADNLGHAYSDISELQDLDMAEYWFTHSLQLQEKHDRLGRARSLGQLGRVTFRRFQAALAAGEPSLAQIVHLKNAENLYLKAEKMHSPEVQTTILSTIWFYLGNIYRYLMQPEQALHYMQKALSFAEADGDRYSTANVRFNIALVLADKGRRASNKGLIVDAARYAAQALEDYQKFGNRAVGQIEQTEKLLAVLNKDLEHNDKGRTL